MNNWLIRLIIDLLIVQNCRYSFTQSTVKTITSKYIWGDHYEMQISKRNERIRQWNYNNGYILLCINLRPLRLKSMECEILIKQLVDSGTEHWLLKTNFHPVNRWISSGLRENWNAAPFWVPWSSLHILKTCNKIAWRSWVGWIVWGC